MDINRFTELAAAFGATRQRWPEPEHALFDHFAGTPQGLGILADAQRVDALLDDWQPAPDDAGRGTRILAAARAPRRRPALVAWLSTGFAASALLGFTLGFVQAPAASDDDTFQDLLLGSTTMMEEFL